MAYSLVAHAAIGGNNPTTSAIVTTGANLIVVLVTEYLSAASTLSDSKGNTWTSLTAKVVGSHSATTLFYCLNPTVGSGHTFTLAGGLFQGLFIQAWSGAAASSAFDAQNGATSASASSLATGSVSPVEDNELIVSGTCHYTSTGPSVNSSFTISDSAPYSAGVNLAGSMAYLVQTTKAAVNPTWSWTGANGCEAVIACFKAASSGFYGRPYYDRLLTGVPLNV